MSLLCPRIENLSYTAWCDRIVPATAGGRIPLEGVLELTYRCPFDCVHCYVRDALSGRELSTEAVYRLIDQLVDAECLYLLLTGGEPLLRPDFPQIYRYAKRKGLLVTVFSNGFLLDETIADLLHEYPPFGVEITLYGMSDSVYRRVTGRGDALGRVLAAVSRLQQRSIPFNLKSMVMQANKDDLAKMQEFCRGEGIDFRFDCTINPRLDGSLEVCRQRLDPREIVALDAADERRAKDWRSVCEHFHGTPASGDRYQCGAGQTYFVIDPSGQVKMCALSRATGVLDPFDPQSFGRIWREDIPARLAEVRDPASPCSSCRMFSICDRCPASAFLETGNYDAPVAFACEIARLRAKAFCPDDVKARIFSEGGEHAEKEESLPEAQPG